MLVGVAGIGLGIPSALKIGVFQNQDWVWGLGLMLSGFFFAFAVLRYGVTRWRGTFINTAHSDIRIGGWWDWAIRLVAVEAVVLMVWWLLQARGEGPAETWTPFSPFNIGTVILQWAIVLAALLLLSRWMSAHLRDGPASRGGEGVGV
jgi:NSS family neurotransmitter:Na+ symporter